MLISEMYKPGTKIVIKAGYGYNEQEPCAFRRAKTNMPATVQAVIAGCIYAQLEDGTHIYTGDSAICALVESKDQEAS